MPVEFDLAQALYKYSSHHSTQKISNRNIYLLGERVAEIASERWIRKALESLDNKDILSRKSRGVWLIQKDKLVSYLDDSEFEAAVEQVIDR